MLKPFYNKKKNIDKRLLPKPEDIDEGSLIVFVGGTYMGIPLSSALYNHVLSIYGSTFSIITADPTPFTPESLKGFLADNGITQDNRLFIGGINEVSAAGVIKRNVSIYVASDRIYMAQSLYTPSITDNTLSYAESSGTTIVSYVIDRVLLIV